MFLLIFLTQRMDSYMPHDFWLLSRGKTKVMGIMFFVYFFSWCFAVLIAIFFVVVQLLSHVQLVSTSWISACLASMSFTVSRSCSNSCPLSQWCHPTISFSVIPFSFCLQSFSASGSFPMSQFFKSGGQSIEASASSVLSVNIWGGTLKSLLQHHSSKASILRLSTLFLLVL